MPSQNIERYLRDHQIRYDTIPHSSAITAQEVAASAHISGTILAKSIIVKIDGKLAILVEPANLKANLNRLKKMLNANNVELAHEYEFQDTFPDCEVGAMPPFGDLYGLDVYIDESWQPQDEIAFNAGNHSELIKMKYSDFESLVNPKHLRLH